MLASLAAPALVLDDQGLVIDANDVALSCCAAAAGMASLTVPDVVEGCDADGTPVRLQTLRSRQIDGTTLGLLRAVEGVDLVDDLGSSFDAAFDHAPVGMAILGANGRYVRVNDALCSMLGRREELVGERAITVRDIPERKRHEADLARLASHDTLTGPRRPPRLPRAPARGDRAQPPGTGTPLRLAILDLDHFKDVNDTYGNPAGDRVLAEVGRGLRSLTRLSEHIARIGGEEFAWVLPGMDGAGAYAAGERARLAVTREPFAHIGDLTVSVGVCELGDGADADQLHRQADVALYQGKDHGRTSLSVTRRGAGRTATCSPIRPSPRASAACACARSIRSPTSSSRATRPPTATPSASRISPRRLGSGGRACPARGGGSARCRQEHHAQVGPAQADAIRRRGVGADAPAPGRWTRHARGPAVAPAAVVGARPSRALGRPPLPGRARRHASPRTRGSSPLPTRGTS